MGDAEVHRKRLEEGQTIIEIGADDPPRGSDRFRADYAKIHRLPGDVGVQEHRPGRRWPWSDEGSVPARVDQGASQVHGQAHLEAAWGIVIEALTQVIVPVDVVHRRQLRTE